MNWQQMLIRLQLKENKIKDSGYMFYVEKDAVSNTVSNVDIANGYNKDADIGKEVAPHEIKAGVYGELYEIDINFVDTLGQTTESKKVLYGTKLAEPSVSAKEGYIFAGWFADKD